MSPLVARRTIRTRSVIGGVLLLGAGLLSGCSVPGFGPDPEEALDRLATALAERDLEGVELAGGQSVQKATEELTTITEGLDPEAGSEADPEADPDADPQDGPEVEGELDTSEDGSATGTLRWTWPVGPERWSYETTVRLTKGEGADGEAWLVRWDPSVVEPSLEAGERLVETTVTAERGEILGADDEPIVTERPVLRVGLDKSTLTRREAVVAGRRVAQLLGIDAGDFLARVRATGDRAFVEGIVYRRQEAPADVLDGLRAIAGGRAISDSRPLAPTKEFAAALLGTVGPATAELVEDSKGRIRPGDDVGLSGLQRRYDEQLAGTRGATVAAVDGEGERRTLFTAEPEPGTPLRTTLDVAAQTTAQEVLADVGPASALVAIRPSTGDLVAVASGPGSKGYNTATFGRYAPGSTFKVVSALALLRAGVTPQTQVSCPPTTVVDGKTFKNYDDYPSSGLGRISFEDALANSCNTAFISQREELAPQALAEAAAALGFGVDRDTGFPSFFGEVGAAGSETQAAANLIGQGTVLASPMAMATVVASVAEGAAVVPRLLPEREPAQEATPDSPLTEAEADDLRTMMRAVVERGSGRLLADLPGGPVIAKTGTAEFGDEPPLPTHAWMVAGRDDLAVAVFVERGDSGSGTAGPVLEQFLREVR